MSGTPRGSFPKSAHLLKRADFQRVYQQGRRHFSGNMTVFYLNPLPPDAASATGVRVGFTVPRALGKAVERNRIRRRVREAVRCHLAGLSALAEPVDIVINPKRCALAASFDDLSAEVERALQVVAQRGGQPPRPQAKERRRSR